MKFIAIGNEAVDQLASNRLLQSIDFMQANCLAEVLTGVNNNNDFDNKVVITFSNSGLYFFHKTKVSSKYIVFDLENSKIFENRSNKEVITLFQKTLRFALRYWNNLAHPNTERHIQDSTKAIIFPFAFTTSSSPFRIVVEKQPDNKRAEKRNLNNKFLLVYKVGNDDGDGRDEQAPTNIYRKAIINIDGLNKSISTNAFEQLPPSELSALNITKLDDLNSKPCLSSLGYENWLPLLTNDQKNFVSKTVNGPERIEGPAGTGKTLCLVLKCINNLIEHDKIGKEHHSLFVTHSIPTKKAILELFHGNDPNGYVNKTRHDSIVSVTVTTLHEWCLNNVKVNISETELLETDAMDSKETQLLYIHQALDEVMTNEFNTHKKFLSQPFNDYLEKENRWNISEMLQHEISIMIKGRADENYEKYKKLERLTYGIPLSNENDLGYVYLIFRKYRDMLSSSRQYDTDDVILTAIGHLDTPIWRRRRETEGVDSIFIDEAHLFNINELSVFHHLIKEESTDNIVYCLDVSQATGDRGLSKELLESSIITQKHETFSTNVKAVFRCSPDIVNLAFSITAAGASLFTNFDDPLELATSLFTEAEERKSKIPIYYNYATDEEMIVQAFKHADAMVNDGVNHKSDILIVPFTTEIYKKMEAYAKNANKPVEMLKHRGDVEVITRAKNTGRYVLGAPDFVGGLEFDGVILVGVDNGRVPSVAEAITADSMHFLTYTAHNRLYVTITRAKYRVEIMGEKTRGPSKLLDNAFRNHWLLKQ